MKLLINMGLALTFSFALLLSQSAQLVKDIDPSSLSSSPGILTAVGGQGFFNAFTPNTGFELWRTDGTAGGTYLVKDIFPGTTHQLMDIRPAVLPGVSGKASVCRSGVLLQYSDYGERRHRGRHAPVCIDAFCQHGHLSCRL